MTIHETVMRASHSAAFLCDDLKTLIEAVTQTEKPLSDDTLDLLREALGLNIRLQQRLKQVEKTLR